MVHSGALTAAAALLCALPSVHAGLYPKSSAVLSLDGKDYDRMIAQSNYTSIVEFYAPWCGHCKNLQPAYEKAAKNLVGLAKVAAVNCDEESNKAFCGGFGVQGFPTLKIVKPGSKPGKPIVEDYQGPRTAKGIVDAVVEKIPNLVKRVADKDLESFLAEANDTAKAILFTDKGKTSATLKALAIDFKGSLKVAQIRNTEKASVELFGITKFPTLILLPGGEAAEGIVYDGEMKKEGMLAFLSQAATPNQDPPPPKSKASKSKTDKKASSKAKESFESASASHAQSEKPVTATDETIINQPTESPSPEVETEKPIVLPPAPPLPVLTSEADLNKNCLGPRTGTCILAFLSAATGEVTDIASTSLAEIAHKHHLHQRKLFPFFVVPSENAGSAKIKESLGLKGEAEVVALNGRRNWWRGLPSKGAALAAEDVSIEAIENWVDSIRLGEGEKKKIPEGLIPEEPEVEESAPEPKPADEPMIIIEEIEDDDDLEPPAPEPEIKHQEL
ncbi:disulfide isomerase protein [Rutstroemia sp. NJR-2017a BBW]|nr:disulfide isomerase protein [Rutstroemia sp. NJR-2017a BBW]